MNRLLFIFTSMLLATNVIGQNLNWQVQHPVSKKWIPLGDKGSVQEAFIQAGLSPDPFVGKNELAFAWFEQHTWILRSSFELSEAQLNENLELDFPSVDTYAAIYLNDSLLGRTENAFVNYRYNIQKFVKRGTNRLRVVFTPPVMYQSSRMNKVGTILPAPNDVGKKQVAPHCRKPQYQFGWDWSLRMLTMGFNAPVKLIVFKDNRVVAHAIRSTDVNEKLAKQEFVLQFAKPVSGNYLWKSDLFGTQKISTSNGQQVVWETVLENPILWWPRGQGDPFLYNDHWVVTNSQGEVIFDKKIRFGVKTVELLQEKDQWGTSFLLKINNRPIFCKGADYIPDDIFPARITDSILKTRVQTMADCNFNMIRVWGGGFYPSEPFLEACDEFGIMVWQDFMFACAMYPGTDAFLENVRNEVRQQIPRLASHASLTLFNGNNEVDVAWKNWGFQSTYKLTKANEKLIENYYQKLFKELLPAEVRHFSNLPYEHTSPLSNWGKDEFYNHGTQHYWGVWHGKDPIEDFGRKSGRFNAEYGFQSFPEYATLSTFSNESAWSLTSDVMKHHQKSYVGNGMIAKHANRLFGETTDFKRFVYYSHLTQAQAVSMAVVSHRIQFPRTTGTLYWQFNDCWPAPSWSSLDYFGQWKALQYQVKKDYEDLTVVAKIDTLGKEKYFLVSGNYVGFGAEITLKVHNFQGVMLDTFLCKRPVLGPTALELFPAEMAAFANQNVLYSFAWNNGLQQESSRTFYHLGQARDYSLVKSPAVSIVEYDEFTGSGILEITVYQTVLDLWITHPKIPIHLKNNFEHFLPGVYRIPFHSKKKFTDKDLLLFFH